MRKDRRSEDSLGLGKIEDRRLEDWLILVFGSLIKRFK